MKYHLNKLDETNNEYFYVHRYGGPIEARLARDQAYKELREQGEKVKRSVQLIDGFFAYVICFPIPEGAQ